MDLPENFKSLKKYIEPYETDEVDFQSKSITIKREKDGIIHVTSSFKLGKIWLNLKAVITDVSEGFGNSTM